jgi:hypothetical protein
LRSCRDADSWSEEDARLWLDAHRESLRARQPRREVGGDAATIAVDFGRRLPSG